MNAKQLSIWIGIIVGGSGAILGAHEYFAKASELKLVAERLDIKILQDRINGAQTRIWTLRDRYEGRQMPQDVKEEIRRLERWIREWAMEMKQRG